MKKTGAQLAVYALEQLGVKYTFGIPGAQTIELYDELNNSDIITPILVTHEGGGAFMAEAISRTSESIGTLAIVPAAGLTHAMSGIGEAFLDGIPMLILSGGTRKDTGKHYQLHQMDQLALAEPITKALFSIETHEEIIPTIYKAYEIATSGEPGPVFIELPANLQLFAEKVDTLKPYEPTQQDSAIDDEKIKLIVSMLKEAKAPMLFLGWGAVDASKESIAITEKLVAPVATSLQGKSAFPNSHPLFTSVGIGASAKPSSQWALARHDLMLAVGVRFSEIATGSYGLDNPNNLIHIDINPDVFDRNYKTTLAMEGDSKIVMKAILEELEKSQFKTDRSFEEITNKIQKENADYFNSWLKEPNKELVSPGRFFEKIKLLLDDDVRIVVDDGKHTFLASELLPADIPRHFISPTDFNCMGYCVPAAIGVKLANPEQQVAAIVGDGAFLMTCMEMLTASTYNVPVLFFVFHDGELGQIAQLQKIPLNRKTCSVLGKVNIEGIAQATGAAYIQIGNDLELEEKLKEAIAIEKSGNHVVVDVLIDYSKKTIFTKGVVKVNLKRFSLTEKVRFISRALKRQITG